MLSARRSGATARIALAAAIACALLLRLLVPQGWMPVRTDAGWRITPCGGAGPMPVAHAMGAAMAAMHAAAAGRSDAPVPTPDSHHCAFAGLSAALLDPPLPVLPLPFVAAAPWAFALPGFVGIGRGLAAPPPPATGPPIV